MIITAKAWNEYKTKMSQISRKAADLMQEWIDKNGTEDRKALISYGNALIMRYGSAAGTLACEMYEKTAAAQGKNIPTAEMAELPTFKEVAKAINGALKKSRAPSAVGRLTKQVGADTTLKNAQRDGAQFAWIPGGGETCAFCIALAARGWQYMSKGSMRGGHAEHIHAGCNCQYSIRFDNSSNVEGYESQRYKTIYDNMPGDNSKRKINSLRRLLMGQNPLTIEQIEFTIKLKNNPAILGKRTPDELKKYLEFIGFDVKPLGKGELRKIPFEEDGGYRINYGGDGYFQYHPEKGSRHGGAYYKISDGIKGKRWYDTTGAKINVKKT